MKAKFFTRNSISLIVESPEEAMLLEAFIEMGNNLKIDKNEMTYFLDDNGVKQVLIINKGDQTNQSI